MNRVLAMLGPIFAWVVLLPFPATGAGGPPHDPGDVFRDCAECPEMVMVPAGSFMMGSNSGDDYERPRHKVTIGQPFAVGKYEVTFRQWKACVKGGGCGGYQPDDEGWGRGDRPVINVSWRDARSYVLWLSRKTGKRYRLLSEAEWEYAARAGTVTPYHFGTSISPDEANYGGVSVPTVPAGSFPPNGFGLHDMHGNVSEWVADCYHFNYQDAPVDGSARSDCPYYREWDADIKAWDRSYVLRGGSWLDEPESLRSANRNLGSAGSRYFFLGFRVARTDRNGVSLPRLP